MKKNSVLKILVIIVAIILVSLISFVGIYRLKNGVMENILPDYLLGKDVSGYRMVTFKVDETNDDDSTTENGDVTTDESGEDANTTNSQESTNTVSEEENTTVEGNTTNTDTEESTEQENTQDNILTKENFEKSKEIIQNRMKYASFGEYNIRVNDEDGTITLELPENTRTDEILQYLTLKGDFTIVDSDTDEVLLNKDLLKDATIMYYPQSTGTTVYLSINFNEEGTKKLEDITKTYIETTDENGETTKKTITMQLDGQKLLTTYFGETISNGQLQISIGNSTNDATELNDYINNATYIAMILNNDMMPLTYSLDINQYITSYINENTIKIIIITVAVIMAILMIYLIFKYKLSGLCASIAFIGYLALLMLIIKGTNIYITLGSIAAIAISLLIQFIAMNKILKSNKEKININETILNTTIMLIPIYIIAIVFCFNSWLPISSFGATMFWGLLLSSLYNYLVVKNVLVIKSEE